MFAILAVANAGLLGLLGGGGGGGGGNGGGGGGGLNLGALKSGLLGGGGTFPSFFFFLCKILNIV